MANTLPAFFCVLPTFLQTKFNIPFYYGGTSLLIVVGVFGGVLVFGFIGLFLGPTLLALGQVLIREWLAHAGPDAPAALATETEKQP